MSARVLVVCTANVCRSPIAEGLLRHHLHAAGHSVQITSAGTRQHDLPVDPAGVGVLAELGIDISAHHPRRFDRSMLADDGADLIITMTREHLRAVATTDRSAWPRTFTYRELIRRASGSAATDTWGEWMEALGVGRTSRDLMGDDAADDIADPFGAEMAQVRQTAAELDLLSRQLVALAPWPS